jgi:sulfatase maturation enzyme AslB (radical SAM superfamily)
VRTTVLTNAMILRGPRLDQLTEIANDNITIQVSLDGGNAEDHDHYRGRGSWEKAVEGIKLLLERDFRVYLSTTETPINTHRLEAICELHRSLGIPDQDHFVRPLARRGYSKDGLELSVNNLVPEVTANIDGIFWHPLSTDPDMQISRALFPLADSVSRIQEQLEVIASTGSAELTTFT